MNQLLIETDVGNASILLYRKVISGEAKWTSNYSLEFGFYQLSNKNDRSQIFTGRKLGSLL